jgi:hypothetical protein
MNFNGKTVALPPSLSQTQNLTVSSMTDGYAIYSYGNITNVNYIDGFNTNYLLI